jgi:hypothetical protein
MRGRLVRPGRHAHDTWLDDITPAVDPTHWRLSIGDGHELALAELSLFDASAI